MTRDTKYIAFAKELKKFVAPGHSLFNGSRCMQSIKGTNGTIKAIFFESEAH